jgi:hypothetical protein
MLLARRIFAVLGRFASACLAYLCFEGTLVAWCLVHHAQCSVACSGRVYLRAFLLECWNIFSLIAALSAGCLAAAAKLSRVSTWLHLGWLFQHRWY